MHRINDRVELLTAAELTKQYQEIAEHSFFVKNLENIKHCSANMFDSCVTGTLLIPDKENWRKALLRCGFYLDEDRLILISDDEKMTEIFDELESTHDFEREEASQVFFSFLEYLIRDDLVFLEGYEKKLDSLEDVMTDDVPGIPKDFDGFVSQKRKELRRLRGYYKLLGEVVDVLVEALTKMGKERSRQLFAYFGNKVERLYHDASEMAEYALQIRDIYMSKISMRQNKVMQLLTIVTTIFMPLTLIAGWYGMNFRYMPELTYRHGYLFAGLLALVVVVAEIIIFKKKKWF